MLLCNIAENEDVGVGWIHDGHYLQISKTRQGSVAFCYYNSIVELGCPKYEVKGVVDVVVVDAPGAALFRFFNLLNILLRPRVNLCQAESPHLW